MGDDPAILAGDVADWPSKSATVSLLQAAGLTAEVGRYSVRIRDFSHFAFQEYGGDLGGPTIEAEALVHDARVVSDALTRAGVRHRFEVYDVERVLQAYVHHDWPPSDDPLPAAAPDGTLRSRRPLPSRPCRR